MTVRNDRNPPSRVSRTGRQSKLLSCIDPDMHPVARAMEIQRRCSLVGFDWNAPAGARDKVMEEIHELDEAVAQGVRQRIDSEMGDVLLAVLNWARLLGTDPMSALSAALDRFEERFAIVEHSVTQSGKSLQTTSLAELERAWQTAKRLLAQTKGPDDPTPVPDQDAS